MIISFTILHVLQLESSYGKIGENVSIMIQTILILELFSLHNIMYIIFTLIVGNLLPMNTFLSNSIMCLYKSHVDV